MKQLGQMYVEGSPEEIQKRDRLNQDTIFCMSKVLDNLAIELGIPPERRGDPDALFDAIENIKEALAYASRSRVHIKDDALWHKLNDAYKSMGDSELYPECSGDSSCCPENEGYGCCKPNSVG